MQDASPSRWLGSPRRTLEECERRHTSETSVTQAQSICRAQYPQPPSARASSLPSEPPLRPAPAPAALGAVPVLHNLFIGARMTVVVGGASVCATSSSPSGAARRRWGADAAGARPEARRRRWRADAPSTPPRPLGEVRRLGGGGSAAAEALLRPELRVP